MLFEVYSVCKPFSSFDSIFCRKFVWFTQTNFFVDKIKRYVNKKEVFLTLLGLMNPNTFAMVSLAATNLSETFDRKTILDWQLDMRLSPDWTIIVGWQMISHWQQKAVINSVKKSWFSARNSFAIYLSCRIKKESAILVMDDIFAT